MAGGVALRYVAMRNIKASPFRYEIDPIELLHLDIETEKADEVFWGIVHSHTHSPAVPSPTDIGMATIYVEPLYLLVSLIRTRRIRSAASRACGRGASSRGGCTRCRSGEVGRVRPVAVNPRTGDRGGRPGRRRGRRGHDRRRERRRARANRGSTRDHPRCLVGGSVAIAVILLSRGLARLAGGADDVPGLLRGVRLVLLALAAAAAGAGWALGAALPLIVALVIAEIDVVETSFLLLVVAGGAINRRG